MSNFAFHRSIYLKILVFIVLIGLSVIVMRPIQASLSRIMTGIRTDFITKLEDFTGMEVRYDSIRPAFFGSFEIRNLKFNKNNDPFFTVALVKINFSVIDLILGKNTAFHTVQINRPALYIDTERDKDTFELIASFTDNSAERNDDIEIRKKIKEFLPEKADYRIRNLFVNITDKDVFYAVENMNMDIKGEENHFLLDMKFDAQVKYSGFSERIAIINTSAELSGKCTNDFKTGDAKISISSFTGLRQNVINDNESFFRPAVYDRNTKNIFSMHPFTAAFDFNNNVFSLFPADKNDSVDYLIRYDAGSGGFSAKFDFDEFKPGTFISFYDYLENAGHLLDIPISGGLSFSHNDNSADYNVNLRTGQQVIYTARNPASITDAFLIRLHGNEKEITVEDFCINSSEATAKAGSFQGIVRFSGDMDFETLRTNADISFEHFSFTGNNGVNAVLNIVTKDDEIQIKGGEIKIGQAGFNALDVLIHPSRDDTGISLLVDCENNGTVYLDAVYNNARKQLDTSLTLASFSVFNLMEIFSPFTDYFSVPFPARNYTESILIDTDIFFTSDFNHMVYNAPNITFTKDVIMGIVSLSGTDRQFTMDEGVFYLGQNELYVAANAVFSDPGEFIFNLNANYLDLAWNIEGQILDRETLIIRDPNGFNAYGSISGTGAVSGYVEAVNFPVPAADFPLYLNFYASMRYTSKDFWTVDIAHFQAGDLNLTEGSPMVKLSGIADQDGASFRNILYGDRIGTLAGSADFLWDNKFSFFHFIVNLTDGNEAGEYYHFEGMLKDSSVNVNASVSGMHVTRFLKGNNTVLVSANADISWDSINLFNAKIDVSSLYAKIGDNALRSSVNVAVSNDELLATDFNIDFAGIRTVVPLVRLNRAEGIAAVNAGMHSYAATRHIQGEMELAANFSPVNSWFDIRQAANSFDGTLKLENVEYKRFKNDTMTFAFSGNDGAYSVSGGIREMLRLEMDEEGNFYMGLSDPMPIRGAIAGTLKDGILDAHCGNFYIDLAHLYALASITDEDLNIAGGYGTGKIDIRGPVLNPEFFGTARGTSVRFQAPKFISQDIRPVPFDLIAEGYEMTFGPVETACGNGGGIVSGWLHFEHWMPMVVNLDINVPKETPMPYNMNVTGFLADGNVSGKLNFAMDDFSKIIEINGVLLMNNTEMSVNSEEFNISRNDYNSANEYNTKVELTVTTGSAVEFFWPNKNSPMLRVTPEMGTVLQISADSEAGQFSIASDIKIRSGELYYFDRSFFIRQGNIVFNENESQFDPRISARAETRERADAGPVTISMIIDNQPLLTFVPRFEASPSLSQLEIYSILGQNLYVQGGEGSDLAQTRFLLSSTTDVITQLVASSDTFGQLVFFRQLERQVRNLLYLDMLSVRTRIIQNAVLSGTGGSGQTTTTPVDNRNRVGNYFDNTTVSIGKYVGQDMFVHGTLTMKYDENRQAFGGIKLEPDIGIEWQNPYFNIRWNFFPYNPQNWWVNDHSVTLSWSKSY